MSTTTHDEDETRVAHANNLTRALLVAGIDAFKRYPHAIPLDLMVGYVYALASTIVAFEGVRPSDDDLVAALTETLRFATTELRKADARADIETIRSAIRSAGPVPTTSGTFRCLRCDTVNDASVALSRGGGQTFAICGVCCQWYRLTGEGTWTPFQVEDVEDAVTRRILGRVARDVAATVHPRGGRH